MKTTTISSSRRREPSSAAGRRLAIAVCPTCGSSKIREVVADWPGEFAGQRYQVAALRYLECPNCGERVFPPESMRRLQAASPAYRKRAATKRPA